MKFGVINFFCQLKRTVCNREVSILKQFDCVCKCRGECKERVDCHYFNSNNNINNNNNINKVIDKNNNNSNNKIIIISIY